MKASHSISPLYSRSDLLGHSTRPAPIATYCELDFDSARTLTLFPDRLVVHTRQSFGPDFETGLPLALLSLGFDRRNRHSYWFITGVAMMAVSLLSCMLLLSSLTLSLVDPGLVLMAGLGIAGLGLGLATHRKVEVLSFKSQDGLVLIELARTARQAIELDSFTEALLGQVRAAKAPLPSRGNLGDSREVSPRSF